MNKVLYKEFLKEKGLWDEYLSYKQKIEEVRQKEYYKANKAKRREYQIAYYHKNKFK